MVFFIDVRLFESKFLPDLVVHKNYVHGIEPEKITVSCLGMQNQGMIIVGGELPSTYVESAVRKIAYL